MRKKCYIFFFFAALVGIGSSVVKYKLLHFPQYFPAPKYSFANNELSQKKIELGRTLFYDPILSKDNTISCASCHSPFNAFAHTDHDLSHGINDQIGKRNAPPLFNLAWHNEFMWDGAINHLDMQALSPLTHDKEMGESLQNVVQKLQATSKYSGLFEEAFSDSLITGEHFLKVLAQFQLTLISANSKYDEVKRGESTFSEQEHKGYALFQEHCNSCHTEPLFSNFKFANNGLKIDSTLMDYGKGAVTGNADDSLQFKIPSLRNLAYSYPYMHDGRFNKISQVLDHYRYGMEESPYLSQKLRKKIKLTDREAIDLTAFLLALGDKEFVFDSKHGFPKSEIKSALNNN